ncbi:MAG: SDR family oxidoreductase [Chitinophagaceae bacterium]|nr:SDR family oxidoreductase [Chitinophagaceae bacterium]
MVKEFENKNQWALILGGSSGLGLASAKKLAMHGCNIIIVHRNSKVDMPAVEQEFAQIKATGVDLLSFNKDAIQAEKRNDIIKLIRENLGNQGKIRVLLHSIAKGNLKPMTGDEQSSLQNDDFHLTLESMAISLYDWTKLLFEKKLFAADSRIISFTSEGNKKAFKTYAAVSAAKAALEAITRNIALEFAPHGIKANCVQAGVTDTVSFRMIPGHEQLKTHAMSRNPFKRLTTPEDVANVVYLLCKDEASWINGTTIIADGGEHIN